MIHNGTFLGLSTIDIIHYVPRFPAVNEKLKSERLLTSSGGPATNAAVAFSALGNNSTLITEMGNNPTAQHAKAELAGHGVEVIDYADQPESPPVIASILVDLSNGTRTVIYSNTEIRRLKRYSADDTLSGNTDIALLDGHYTAQAVDVAKTARALGIPTVLDGGGWKKGEESLLPFIDYAICSADFFPPGCENDDEVIFYLADAGIQNIAITKGEDPIQAFDGEQHTQIPVMKIKALDTLGAGDILHGAFCHYILQNDFLTSLAKASEVASQSCMSLGTRCWIEQEKFI